MACPAPGARCRPDASSSSSSGNIKVVLCEGLLEFTPGVTAVSIQRLDERDELNYTLLHGYVISRTRPFWDERASCRWRGG